MRSLAAAPLLSLASAMTLSAGLSAAPARLIQDIQVGPGTSTHLDQAIELGRRALFVADDQVHGRELWVSDGSPEGTRLVRDVDPGPSGAFPAIEGLNLVAWRDRAYFTATDGVHGLELWTTDGTEDGTRMVKDIRPGAASSVGPLFAPLDSLLLFAADDGVHGLELWGSDGTPEGTRLVHDITPGPQGSPFVAPTRFDGFLFFASAPYSDGSDDVGLWRTDGTEEGTIRLALLPGDFDSAVVYRGALWLITFLDGIEPCQLWRSDGTPVGTSRVADLPVFLTGSPKVAGDTLFFLGFDVSLGLPPPIDPTGFELWASDGTGAGTHLVKDIWPGPLSSSAGSLTAVGDTLFLTARDPVHGIELWKSDGSEAGTVVVKDIVPGIGQGAFGGFGGMRNVEDILLFSAFDGVSDVGLWRSDGTEEGTYLVQAFAPNLSASSGPRAFLTFGRRVAFTALEPATGREPWAGRAAILTRQPARALEDLASDVRALGLLPGIEESLAAKLTAAHTALRGRGGARVALRLLDAFEREVDAHTPVPITSEDAADLLEFAEEIEGLLVVEDGGAPVLARPPAFAGRDPSARLALYTK